MFNLQRLIDDFNGKGKTIKVPFSKKLTGRYSLDISKYSGLVSVKNRRNSKEIADEWSNKIFGKKFSKSTYTAKIPAVVARQVYVLETLIKNINLSNKSLCDLGAGEGDFLKMLKEKKITKNIFGIEPSKKNCKKLSLNRIKNFQGTLEDFVESNKIKQFDILTMMWTLCNTSNC